MVRSRLSRLLAFLMLVLVPPARVEAPEDNKTLAATPRTDLYGDLLPPGAIARLGGVRRFQTEGLDVRSLIYARDGRTLVSVAGRTIQFWEADSGKELRRFAIHGEVTSMARSPDGKRLAIAGPSSAILDADTGKVLHDLDVYAGHGNAVAFSPDGKTLALGQRDGGTKLWDVSTGKPLVNFELPGETRSCVAIAADGRTVATGDGRTVNLWDPATGKKLRSFTGHTETLNAVAFSPDGRTLASGSYDQTVRLWDVNGGAQRRVLRVYDGAVLCLTFSPDGKMLATGSWSRGRIGLWDLASGKRLRNSDSNNHMFALAFSPDGRTLAAGACGAVQLSDTVSGEVITTPHQHEVDFETAIFSRDGNTMTTLCGDRTVRSWKVGSGKELTRLPQPPEKLALHGFGAESRPSLSADGRMLAWCSWEKTVQIWDLAAGRRNHWLRDPEIGKGNEGWEDRVAFSADGKVVAIASDDRVIRIRERASGKCLVCLRGHDAEICSLVFGPDGRSLASGSSDQTVRLWDTVTGKEVRQLPVQALWVPLVVFSPDGKLLAAVGQATVDVWDVASGVKRYQIKRQARSAAFSVDGQLLATSSGEDVGIELWQAATGKYVRRLESSNGRDSPVFSADGTMVAAAWRSRIFLWDAATGKMLRWCEGPETWESLHGPRFSADGKMVLACDSKNIVWSWESSTGKVAQKVATTHGSWNTDAVLSRDLQMLSLSSRDQIIHLCRLPAGKTLARLAGHEGTVHCTAFSPDDTTLASGGLDSTVRLWNMATGREIRRFQGHTNGVLAIAFSADGRTLASGGFDHTARIWDVATGREVRRLEHRDQVDRLALSPDGRILATAGSHKPLCLWDLTTGKQLPAPEDTPYDTFALVFSPDGKTLASSSPGAGVIRLWEVASGKERRRFQTEGGFSLVFSADGKVLASLGGPVMLWDVTGQNTTARPAVTRLSDQELARLCQDLAGADASRAYRAIWKLAAVPGAAVPCLGTRLEATSAQDRRIERLIAELDDERFAVRAKASSELAGLGRRAEFALRQALDGQPSLEVRQRLEALLQKLGTPGPALPSEQLGALRTIEVLEQAGTAEAQQVLETLAKETPWPRLRQEAKAAAERMATRRRTAP